MTTLGEKLKTNIKKKEAEEEALYKKELAAQFKRDVENAEKIRATLELAKLNLVDAIDKGRDPRYNMKSKSLFIQQWILNRDRYLDPWENFVEFWENEGIAVYVEQDWEDDGMFPRAWPVIVLRPY